MEPDTSCPRHLWDSAIKLVLTIQQRHIVKCVSPCSDCKGFLKVVLFAWFDFFASMKSSQVLTGEIYNQNNVCHLWQDLNKNKQTSQEDFYRTQVSLGSDLWVLMSVTHRLFADLTDATLADDDSNSIPTDDVNKVILGNVAIQVAPSGG